MMDGSMEIPRGVRKVNSRGMFRRDFIFVDTKDGAALALLLERGICDGYVRKYAKKGEDFLFVTCSVRARDEGAFLSAMREFARTAAQNGVPYASFCERMEKILSGTAKKGGKKRYE